MGERFEGNRRRLTVVLFYLLENFEGIFFFLLGGRRVVRIEDIIFILSEV